MDFDDLQSTKNYQAWRAYGQSKLANVLFNYELARRLGPDVNVTANCLHPGIVNTELARYGANMCLYMWPSGSSSGNTCSVAEPNVCSNVCPNSLFETHMIHTHTLCIHTHTLCTPTSQRYLFDANNIQWWQKPLISASQLFLKTPAQGAATSIYLATSDEVAGVSGKYYVDCVPRTSSNESYDVEVAKRLWEESVGLTGAPADVPVANVAA